MDRAQEKVKLKMRLEGIIDQRYTGKEEKDFLRKFVKYMTEKDNRDVKISSNQVKSFDETSNASTYIELVQESENYSLKVCDYLPILDEEGCDSGGMAHDYRKMSDEAILQYALDNKDVIETEITQKEKDDRTK